MEEQGRCQNLIPASLQTFVLEMIGLLMMVACRHSRVSLELRTVSCINRLQLTMIGRVFSLIAPSNHGVTFVLLFATASVAFDYSDAGKPLWGIAIVETAKKPFLDGNELNAGKASLTYALSAR